MTAQRARQASDGFLTPAEFAVGLSNLGLASEMRVRPVTADVPREAIEQGERIFDEWILDNSDLIREMGGSGDTHTLFAALWAAWKNKR
jgi:hypothetical protein